MSQMATKNHVLFSRLKGYRSEGRYVLGPATQRAPYGGPGFEAACLTANPAELLPDIVQRHSGSAIAHNDFPRPQPVAIDFNPNEAADSDSFLLKQRIAVIAIRD